MLFKASALIALLAVVSNAQHTCESDPKCAKVICSVFDNVCDAGEICEQLDKWPWFQCHLESQTQDASCEQCGHFNECHEDAYGKMICTCEGKVYEPGRACIAREQDNPDDCGGRDCHMSSECIMDGSEGWCICPDGRLVGDEEPCPGWEATEHTDEFTQEDYDSAGFDCSACTHDMECWDADGNGEMGCYCEGRLVYKEYPCGEEGYLGWKEDANIESFVDADPLEAEEEMWNNGVRGSGTPPPVTVTIPPTSETLPSCGKGYCLGHGSRCFTENGLPVCRCEIGVRVARDEDCP